ncbi:MAG: ThuA domain-containing protein [Opitutales bacterium]
MSKRALILSGGWPGHEPEKTSKRFAGLLEVAGFTVEVSETLDVVADAEKVAASYDLLIPNWTMGEINGEQLKGLCDAVAQGVGVGGFHGGAGDAFRSACEFQFMMGGQFVAHPGNIKDYTVYIADPAHPITQGIEPAFAFTSEQYYLHVDPAVRVLATTLVNAPTAAHCEGVQMPVAWTKMHGAGRVYYCALGHQDAEFDTFPMAQQLVLNGLLWATR